MKYFLLLLTLLPNISFAQGDEHYAFYLDSLKSVAEGDGHDTARINAYLTWDELIYIEDPELDLEINQTVFEISKNNLETKNLTVREKRYYLRYIARTLNVIGLINIDKGNYLEAQENFHNSLKVAEYVVDSSQYSGPLNNLGMIYKLQGFPEKSLIYYEKAMEIDGDTDPMSKGIYLNNMGQCYADLDNEKLALNFYQQSMQLSKSSNDLSNLADATLNIGDLYLKNNNLDSAMKYYDVALKIATEIKYAGMQSVCFSKIGSIYLLKEDPKQALIYCNKGLDLLEKENSPAKAQYCHECLYLAYNRTNNIKKAFYHLEELMMLDKQLNDQAKLDELMTTQFQFQYQKKQISDSLELASQQQMKEIQLKSDLKTKSLVQYILFGGLGALLIIALVLLRNYRLKKRDHEIISHQKQVVEDQKLLVEEKNHEITDSINYAKRLQEAILPTQFKFDRLLPDSFILYLPKDIVAGDFYWLEETESKILFAIADCTGHGVPGALVSVVCHNALNRSVKEFKLERPDLILNKTRELVIDTFASSDSIVKDGMDISLCSYDRKTKVLEFSGANNSLYLLKGDQIIEYKADKQPIGKFINQQPFTNHVVEFQSEDKVYLFTDGFADQFGGEKGKKYKYSNFKELLIKLSQNEVTMQNTKLKAEFETWKGFLEQLDDVCILGLDLKNY